MGLPGVSDGVPGDGLTLGPRIRGLRLARRLSVRELAKRVGCSASHISAIERGLTQPSISVLTAVVTELDVAMDSLFGPRDLQSRAGRQEVTVDDIVDDMAAHMAGRLIRHEAERPAIRIQSGVVSQMLLPSHHEDVDFCIYVYEPGGASVADAKLIRHPGSEFGLVLEGSLRMQLGFDEHWLEEGDSIAFRSNVPHRFWNDTDSIARAVWISLAAF